MCVCVCVWGGDIRRETGHKALKGMKKLGSPKLMPGGSGLIKNGKTTVEEGITDLVRRHAATALGGAAAAGRRCCPWLAAADNLSTRTGAGPEREKARSVSRNCAGSIVMKMGGGEAMHCVSHSYGLTQARPHVLVVAPLAPQPRRCPFARQAVVSTCST